MRGGFFNYRKYKRKPDEFVFSKKPRPKGPNYFDELKYHRVYIRNNSKALFFTLTDKDGRVLCSFSAGVVGLKGSKRLGTPAVDLLSRRVATFAKQLNIKTIALMLKVTNNLFNITAMKVFMEAGFHVGKIVEQVPISHNGRRYRKTRRI